MDLITDADLALAAELGQQLRVDSVRSSTSAGSGHPTSSMSAADLMAVLVSRHLRYDLDNPEHPGNDHLIFSKGHASPCCTRSTRRSGVDLRRGADDPTARFGSRLEGHPTPGPALGRRRDRIARTGPARWRRRRARGQVRWTSSPFRVWVLCGDSEMAEGSIWEALDKACHYELANLIVIVDVNRLGQRGPTELDWDIDVYAPPRDRVRLPGDRHRRPRRRRDRPGAGRGRRGRRSADGRSSPAPSRARASPRSRTGRTGTASRSRRRWPSGPIVELGGERNLLVRGPLPAEATPRRAANGPAEVKLPAYDRGEKVATRKAYGDALAALGARHDVVALDGEVSNSTYADEFAKAYPGALLRDVHRRAADGRRGGRASVRGYRPFASTFAAFFSRAYDFIRMAAISEANIRLVRLARRRGDRRGRPVPDGARGPGHAARGARLHGAVPERRHQRRRSWSRRWPT